MTTEIETLQRMFDEIAEREGAPRLELDEDGAAAATQDAALRAERERKLAAARTLLRQINALDRTAGYAGGGRDPYKMASRIAVLTYLFGGTPASPDTCSRTPPSSPSASATTSPTGCSSAAPASPPNEPLRGAECMALPRCSPPSPSRPAAYRSRSRPKPRKETHR